MKQDFEYEQMLKGELYYAPDILPDNKSITGQVLAQQINQVPLDNLAEIIRLEKKLFKKTGEHFYVHPPFQVDYGRHLTLGENFYANMDCIFLDVNEIIFGDNVMVGPRVNFFTAGHPTDPKIRGEELEFGLPIHVGNNVWIGGGATILPGVTIGNNTIVAAGAVVTKDVPESVIVGGNPARVIREITMKDQEKWQIKKDDYLKQKNKSLEKDLF